MIWLWCARAAWAVLPLSAGSALADALDDWSTGPARVAAVLMWAAWTCGLVALIAPRPWGVTLLRVVAPAALGCAIATAWSTSGTSAALAITSAAVAAVLALSAPVAEAGANAMAYGDERRFPLRIPTPLLLGPVPIAVALVIASVATGPLLLADAKIVAGVLAVVVAVPITIVAVRSLHALARRWLVLVPAGVVVADPLTLAEPTLMMRRDVVSMRPSVAAQVAAGALDLRLGTLAGSVEIVLREAQPFARRRGRAAAELLQADRVIVAPARAREALRVAGTRRLPTG